MKKIIKKILQFINDKMFHPAQWFVQEAEKSKRKNKNE
jgi:hypothetical protein